LRESTQATMKIKSDECHIQAEEIKQLRESER